MMKKFVILLAVFVFFNSAAYATSASRRAMSNAARSNHSHHSSSHKSSGHSHSSGHHSGSHHSGSHHPSHHSNSYYNSHYHDHSSSQPVILTDSVQELNEIKFPNCYQHYAIKDTTTDYYSDGSKKVYTKYTLYNSDGAVLAENCKDLKHIIYGGRHYFIINNSKGYQLVDENAEPITERKYNYMTETGINRLIVRSNEDSGLFSNGKYGIIDFAENDIIPIKYSSINSIGNDIFITKLNGYYGITDIDGNEMIPNNCDSIKNIHNALLIKRYGKYGLANKYGTVILGTNYDNIKKLGDYILVKKNNMYGVWDSNGKIISEIIYKSIKLDRNMLHGKTNNDEWVDIR
ncbi:WG repeat-containing protein [bacterium]|nr:WG repeat-containing protein [bacterium]